MVTSGRAFFSSWWYVSNQSSELAQRVCVVLVEVVLVRRKCVTGNLPRHLRPVLIDEVLGIRRFRVLVVDHAQREIDQRGRSVIERLGRRVRLDEVRGRDDDRVKIGRPELAHIRVPCATHALNAPLRGRRLLGVMLHESELPGKGEPVSVDLGEFVDPVGNNGLRRVVAVKDRAVSEEVSPHGLHRIARLVGHGQMTEGRGSCRDEYQQPGKFSQHQHMLPLPKELRRKVAGR